MYYEKDASTAGSRRAKNQNGYCPNHATGIKLPDGWAVTPLQYGE